MPIARAVVTIPNSLLGSPGPLSSTTMHFDTGATPIDQALGDDILEAIRTGWQLFDGYFGAGCGEVATARIYDLSDATPREPVALLEFVIDPDETQLPGECAVNVRYRGARVVGVPSQRARGTIQIGPLGTEALEPTTGQITTACYGAVAEGFESIAAAADPDWPWVVGSIAHGFVPVTNAGINNEFGTVGSRQGIVSGGVAITLP